LDVGRWVFGLSGASQTTIEFVVTKPTTNTAFALLGGGQSAMGSGALFKAYMMEEK
jgi:hypothetical protein